jgi:hypothetical protein
MTERQLQIANKMLKWYADRNGVTSSDSWDCSDLFKDYEWIEPGQVRHILRQQGYMIPTDKEETMDMLTKKGWNAVKAESIENYLKQEEEKENNKYMNIQDSNLNFGINYGQQISNKGSQSFYNGSTVEKGEKKSWVKTVSLITGSIGALVTIAYYVHEVLK